MIPPNSQLLFGLIILLTCCCVYSNCATVQTELGSIKGWESTSRDGKTYWAFTKIPYAKPPVGNLRFKAPEPIKKWTEELDATQEGPMCIQAIPRSNSLAGQEDCLYLNVYTPKSAKNLSVLVFIHGGAFKLGSPGPKDMADYFMDEEVILVTLTYRLGTLGFLSLEDTVIPGNYGLKDQAMALLWVKDNIESFGGNAQSITVFGGSAGGASAHFHMYSPLTRDVIKGVIAQSGNVNKVWAVAPPGMMKDRTLSVAKSLGCPLNTPLKIFECLQQADSSKLALAINIFFYWENLDMVPIRAVIEPKSQEAFLTEDPYSVKSTIPWIVGFHSGEQLLDTMVLERTPGAMEEYAKRIDEILRKQLSLDPTLKTTSQIVKKLKDHYFQDTTPKALLESYGKLFADLNFIYPILESVYKHKGSSFVYYLEHRGEATLLDRIFKPNTNTEPCHGDELFLLFNYKKEYSLQGTEVDKKISKAVVKMWANFAKFQNPTPPEESEVIWPEYNKKKLEYLRITTRGMVVGNRGWNEVYNFWDDLFKNAATGQDQ